MSKQIESPCIAICQLDDEEQFCIGCFRTPQEIELWPHLSTDEKKHVLQKIATRKSEENT